MPIKCLLTILLCFLTACSTKPSRDKKSSTLYYDLGVSYLQKGQPHEALSALLKATHLNPNDGLIYHQLGLTYFSLEEYKKSEDAFYTALSHKADFTEARVSYARVLIKNKKYLRARKQLRQSMRDLTYKNRYKIYFNYGLSYFDAGNFEKSIKYFQRSLKAKQNNCYSYTYYGRALYEVKDFQSAKSVFRTAINLCKPINYDEAHYYAALNYLKAGDKLKALALMNEAILYFPGSKNNQRSVNTLKLMKLNKI